MEISWLEFVVGLVTGWILAKIAIAVWRKHWRWARYWRSDDDFR